MRRVSFTLLELVVAIVLLGLIAAFIFPELGGEVKRRSLPESADRLRALIVMTQAQAVREGLRYRIQFPGTPDPLDRHADTEVDVPVQTAQPEIWRQKDPRQDPQAHPDMFEPVSVTWKPDTVLLAGTRCVSVLPVRSGSFDEISPHSPIAGPSITEGFTTFVPLTFNPDGTSESPDSSCEWVAFVLTDLHPDAELGADDVGHIFNVIVDGRTGQVWIQRALRVEEVELMQERGAARLLHIDFTRPDLITERNILEIHMRQRAGMPASGGGG